MTGGLDHPLGLTDLYMRLSLGLLLWFQKSYKKPAKKASLSMPGIFPPPDQSLALSIALASKVNS
jgi:hypothetical protein